MVPRVIPEPAAEEGPTDAQRYPTLTPAGQAMLRFLREHPNAPIYRNQSGNRLGPADVERVRAFEEVVQSGAPRWRPGALPEWVGEFVQRCFEQVPHYRRLGTAPRDLADVPAVSRTDFSRDIAQFVPDDVELRGVINFRTTGTTGQPMIIPSHPTVSAAYLAFFKKALARRGVHLQHGAGQVGVVLVGWQRQCFTYVSVTPTMGESGLAKINLHPLDWRDPDDRAKYLDALDAEVYTGDPISFRELARLPLTTRPKALLSTSMMLLPGMRRMLEERFGCPVLDIYSLNESGPVAVREADGHALLQARLYVEILGPDGRAVPAGERGEITLTGGFNPYLPLLRYRTGDYGALEHAGDVPRLVGLEGRPPTIFVTSRGEPINNIDVTHALTPFAIAHYSLHQDRAGALWLRLPAGQADLDGIRGALLNLFGPKQALAIVPIAEIEGKWLQYSSEIDAAASL